MKKLKLLILLNFIIQTTASSQSCLPEGITFTTQAEIDSFQINYPGCTEIEGDVDIEGDGITNLNGLHVLTAIWGYISVEYNDALSSLTGLDNVTSIGGDLNIWYNHALTSLSGLDNLTTIVGGLRISGNDAVTSLTGLDNVTSIGEDLGIYNNDNLTNLTGLDNVTSIGEDLRIKHQDALTSLTGLDNVTSIGGDLQIQYNDALPNLTGLNSLTSVGGYLWIGDNAALSNLAGLDNVTSIGEDFRISYNPAMTSLTGFNNLTSVGGELGIAANATLTSLMGLDNVTSTGGDLTIGSNAALTSLTGLENMTSVGGNLGILGNDALTSFSGLYNLTTIAGELRISGNDVVTSLMGLDNINEGSIGKLTIINNNSLANCEVGSICNYLANPNGTVIIYSNAPGCNNPPEVANACGFTLSCLPYGNYYFFTQSEIDDFHANYPGCTELEGLVKISGSNISNLNGLSVVTSIGVSLSICYNDTLTGLKGLDNIDAGSINYLRIYDNPYLSTCEVRSVCDYLAIPNVDISIHDNAAGCNSREEVEVACDTISVESLDAKDGLLIIYPNPISTSTTIEYELKEPALVTLLIYNHLGQWIETLVNKQQPKGKQQVTWDTEGLPSGMYFYRLTASNQSASGKLIVVK